MTVETESGIRRSPTGGLRMFLQGNLFERWVFPASLVLLILYGCIRFVEFRSVDNARNILTFSSIALLVALGETFVVLGRGFDLSAGSMMGLSGALFAELYLRDVPLVLACLATILAGMALGAFVNGGLITKFNISFIIVTLGTFTVFRSQAQVLTDGESIVIFAPALDTLANGRTYGVPNLVLIAGGVYVVSVFVLRATVYGRSVYAVGANPEAARLAGINVDRVTIVNYAICATLASVAGLLTIGQLGSVQPSSAGAGMELSAIAAVLLGGTRFSGGYGGPTRTLLGVFFLGILNNILFISGVSSFWQGTAAGLVLIVAVAIDRSRKD